MDGLDVCVACDTGKDLSAGIVLAMLASFFDDTGTIIDKGDKGNPSISMSFTGSVRLSTELPVYQLPKHLYAKDWNGS